MPENLKTEPVKADLTDIRIIIGAALGLIGVFLLIIALVAIIVIAGISLLGKNIGNLFNTVADNVK